MLPNTISHSRDTIGVRGMPDRLDGGTCHIRRHSAVAVVRVNLGGIYTSLCAECRDALVAMLADPAPAPAPRTTT